MMKGTEPSPARHGLRSPLSGRRRARRWVVGLTAALALIGTALLGVKVFGVGSARSGATSGHAPGTAQEFHYLAAQSSNYCSLWPEAIASYSRSGRLQGSCCNPMDLATYQAQVRELKQYGDIVVIPPDPYDVPVPLAKQLLVYDQSIHLAAAEQSVYDQAMNMTPDKGPCCCKCWRWDADAGLAKYLITERHFGARQVATVVALVNGCGGSHSAGLTTS